jgi:hypothetical protein
MEEKKQNQMIYPDYLKTYIQLPTNNQHRHATKNSFFT